MKRRESRCVGLREVEVEVHRGEWAQRVVGVHQRGIQKIPELGEPAPFQCLPSDRSCQSWMRHPFLGFRVEAAQGLGVKRVVADPLVGVEKEEDQG